MASERIDGQYRENQYNGEEYEDSSSLSMLMEDLVSLCSVGSGASSSGSQENNESRSEIGLTGVRWIFSCHDQQHGAMISNCKNSGFMGVLDCWVCGFLIFCFCFCFFLQVFLVLLCMGFLVFDFFFFGCNFFSQI